MSFETEESSWQQAVQNVQADRDRSIAQVEPAIHILPEALSSRVIDAPRKYLTPSELAITESSCELLVESLARGRLTTTAVTKAFLRRAAIAQKLVRTLLFLGQYKQNL